MYGDSKMALRATRSEVCSQLQFPKQKQLMSIFGCTLLVFTWCCPHSVPEPTSSFGPRCLLWSKELLLDPLEMPWQPDCTVRPQRQKAPIARQGQIMWQEPTDDTAVSVSGDSKEQLLVIRQGDSEKFVNIGYANISAKNMIYIPWPYLFPHKTLVYICMLINYSLSTLNLSLVYLSDISQIGTSMVCN